MSSSRLRWHQVPKVGEDGEDRVYAEVWNHIKSIDRDQQDLQQNFIDFARLYSNREEPGLSPGGRSQVRSGFETITDNIIQQVVDTGGALVGKSRPKVTVLTDGAGWEMQKLARDVDQFLWGMFRALEVHEKMAMMFRDAEIFGIGIVHLFTRDGEIRMERVLPSEFYVDESELPHGGMPREVHHVRRVPKEVLKGLYPDHADWIEQASSAVKEQTQAEEETDLVAVVHSYRLASPGNDEDKGRETISISTKTLYDEDYDRDWFPFVWYHWNPPLTGFYGQGLVEGLLGFQIRLNELNDFIRKCQDLIAVPRVAVEQGSQIYRPQLDDEIGAVFSYIGQPPQWFTPQALNAEIYNYAERIKAAAFEFAGISTMAAHAKRPEGIEAAVALRELSDHQSQRLSGQQQRYEARFMDVGKLILLLTKELREDSEPAPAFMNPDLMETIDWDLVDFDKKKFVLQVQASSIMNETPAGRLQKVVEMSQYNLPIAPEEFRQLLDLPDLQRSNELAVAKRRHAEWLIHELSEGRYHSPEAFMDLPMTVNMVTSAYLNAVRAGAPEEILEGFRDFLTEAESALSEAQAQEQAVAQQAAQAQQLAEQTQALPPEALA